jgi:hypothetical protein
VAAIAGCAGIVLEPFWLKVELSCELTSKKWYITINIIATEPRKMASLYKSSSDIMVSWSVDRSLVVCLMNSMCSKPRECAGYLVCAKSNGQHTEMHYPGHSQNLE